METKMFSLPSRGFDKISSTVAALRRNDKAMHKRIRSLEMTIHRLKDINKSLIDENELLRSQLTNSMETPKMIESIGKNFPRLVEHINCLFQNSVYCNNRSNKYPGHLKLWYLHMASFGESFYNQLHYDFGFPVFRTVQNYKKKSIDESGINISMLDGSVDSINKLLSFCWNKEVDDDNRCVIAVDAASITASVVINKIGEVTGLTTHLKIEKAAREALAEGIDAFSEFIEANKSEICKYFFICYLNPLSPNRKPFPIVAVKTINGNANEELVAFVNQLISVLQDSFQNVISIIGVSFDGDPGWLHLLGPILDTIPKITLTINETDHQEEDVLYNLEDFNIPLSNLLLSHEGLLPFEDILHLLKCGRYRIINNPIFCTWPSIEEKNFKREDLHEVGIPEYILDDSRCKKMEDIYPLIMFNYKILANIVSSKPELLPIFAPLTLLCEAIFNYKLTRTERLQNITIAFSFMLLYREEIKLQQSPRENCVFDMIFCNKFISLCQSLSVIISNPKAVHLGALGTHWLEHFFGHIRQLCKGDDSVDRVEQALVYTVISKYISYSTGQIIEPQKRKSRSDSGCILEGEVQEIEQPVILDSLIKAFVTIRFAHSIQNQCIIDLLTPYEEIINQIDQTFQNIPDSFMEYIFHSTSTKQLKMQGGGGFTSYDRMISGTELVRFIH